MDGTTEQETENDQRNDERYHAAMHGVQSAVLTEIEVCGPIGAGADSKHLRVGVNSAMVNDHAVAELLITKGVFTRSEYLAQLAASAELELDRMTKHVRRKTGLPNLAFG